jgi:ArsR family transcriptional regulator
MDVDVNSFIQTLRALADETRFRIIDLLLTHDLCVGALATRVSISKAAVSQHLQILRKAGLVKGEKRGYWTHYSVNRNVVRDIAEELTQRAGQAPDSRMACLPSVLDDINSTDKETRK